MVPLESISVYPNPTSPTLNIDTPAKGVITIHNTSAQQLLEQIITLPTTTIDVSGWKSGVYFVKVTEERKLSAGKFVKL